MKSITKTMRISNNLTRSIEINEALDIITDLYHLALANDLVTTNDEKILVIRSLDLIKNTLRFANEIPSSQQFSNKVGIGDEFTSRVSNHTAKNASAVFN